jgi:LytR cell envelope-related transcriptional attenuator
VSGAGGRVRPGRSERRVRARRGKRIEAAVALVLVVVGLAYASSQLGGDGTGTSPTASSSSGPQKPATLLALSVTGSPHVLLAVVGADGTPAPAAMTLPANVTIVIPGQGQAGTADLQALPGRSLQVGVSNAVGAWVSHYGVLDLVAFAALVDRAGGLTVDLPDVYTVGGKVVGPGSTQLDGTQIRALLSDPAPDLDAEARWEAVLAAFLASPDAVRPDDLAETDAADAVTSLLRDAQGAEVTEAPVREVGGSTFIPDQPTFDQTVGALFGTAEPTNAILQNGNGRPGVGEEAARLLIPAGFRIVISQNAGSFDHARTDIVATDEAHRADAERAKQALGVGVVSVSGVPSGLADVSIVVGEDFEA